MMHNRKRTTAWIITLALSLSLASTAAWVVNAETIQIYYQTETLSNDRAKLALDGKGNVQKVEAVYGYLLQERHL